MRKKYRITNINRFILSMTVMITLLVCLICGTSAIIFNDDCADTPTYANTTTEQPLITTVASTTTTVVNTLPNYNIALSEDLQRFTWNQCLYMNVDYELILGLLRTESNFNANARNGSCKGMGQLSTSTGNYLARVLQIQNFNVYDAKQNISCVIYHVWELRNYWISQGYSEEDATYAVLGAYNRGLYGFKSYIRNNHTIVTSYANKVLTYKTQLEAYGYFY